MARYKGFSKRFVLFCTLAAVWLLLTGCASNSGPRAQSAEPSELQAVAGDGRVDLSWQASGMPGLVGYNVYRSTSQPPSTTGSPLNAEPHVGTNYRDETVSNGTTYHYVVTAVDESGNESDPSNMATALPAVDAGGGNSGTGSWRALPASPSVRQEVSYVALDGELFLAGGGTVHEAYDPDTGSWRQLQPLPADLDHIQGVATGGMIFYIGGLAHWPGPAVASVYSYDPDVDSFKQRSPMPRPRGAGGAAAFGGKIYYAGGLAGTSGSDARAVAWFDVYDPSTDTWSQLPDMPVARDHFHAVVLDGKFYAIGGREKEIDASITRVDVFDFSSGTWTTPSTTLPTARSGFATAVLNGEILVIGGEGGGLTFDVVEAYDPASNQWRELAPMLTGRHGIQAAVCGGAVYIAAGGVEQGNAPSNAHEVFSYGEPGECPSGGSQGPSDFNTIDWQKAASAPIPRLEAQGVALNGRLYVFGGYQDSSFGPVYRADAYDPASDSWQRIADLPVCTTHAGTTTDGSAIYLAGGYIGKNMSESGCSGQIFGTEAVWRYDPASDEYASLPDLPLPRAAGSLEYVSGKLHYFGGINRSRTADTGEHWALDLSSSNASWQALAPLPNPRNHLGSAVVGGTIYAVGGSTGYDEGSVSQDDVHAYDATSDSWRKVASLPRALSHISGTAFEMEGRLVVAGGEYSHGVRSAEVYSYRPSADRWEELSPLPNKRYAGVAGTIDGRIYFSGGSFSHHTYRGIPRQ